MFKKKLHNFYGLVPFPLKSKYKTQMCRINSMVNLITVRRMKAHRARGRQRIAFRKFNFLYAEHFENLKRFNHFDTAWDWDLRLKRSLILIRKGTRGCFEASQLINRAQITGTVKIFYVSSYTTLFETVFYATTQTRTAILCGEFKGDICIALCVSPKELICAINKFFNISTYFNGQWAVCSVCFRISYSREKGELISLHDPHSGLIF